MLYDKRWDEVKADPLSLESLIAWLEKQPASAEYCFMDTGGCLFFNYLSDSGIKVHSVGGAYYRAVHDGDEIEFPKGFESIAAFLPHTFGAALERARSLAVS